MDTHRAFAVAAIPPASVPIAMDVSGSMACGSLPPPPQPASDRPKSALADNASTRRISGVQLPRPNGREHTSTLESRGSLHLQQLAFCPPGVARSSQPQVRCQGVGRPMNQPGRVISCLPECAGMSLELVATQRRREASVLRFAREQRRCACHRRGLPVRDTLGSRSRGSARPMHRYARRGSSQLMR